MGVPRNIMTEKERFKRTINKLLSRKDLTTAERIAEVEKFLDDYIAIHGAFPEGANIEELTDYILAEELNDPDRMKMRNNEYPFMSERQLRRRHSKEVPISRAENIASNGRDYRKPARRKRSKHENAFMDRKVKSRNKERRKTYNDFKYGRSPGIFTVDIETGKKTIHDPEKYEKFYGEIL
jgi:hypothetical protein